MKPYITGRQIDKIIRCAREETRVVARQLIDIDRDRLLDNPPSKAEFLDWKTNRVTKYLIAIKESEYESLKEEWARGDFTRDTVDATNQLTLKKLGESDALYNLIEDVRELGGDVDEEEK